MLMSRVWTSAVDFRRVVEPILRQNEAANNLMLGLLTTLNLDDAPLMVTVDDDASLILAALQTSRRFNLVLSLSELSEAASHLATALWEQRVSLPGVLGPAPLARSFSEQWVALSQETCRAQVHERIYELTRVLEGPTAPGRVRWADPADRDWLIAWAEEFVIEALPEASVKDASVLVNSRLMSEHPASGFLVLEIQRKPVSIAGFAGPTGTGIRVGPVYTPPAFRGRGYGSHVARELSRSLLAAGYGSVFLFTDLTNPTSNKIYQAIGYRPVVDVDQYAFYRS